LWTSDAVHPPDRARRPTLSPPAALDDRLCPAGAAALLAAGRDLRDWPPARAELVHAFEVDDDPAAWLGRVHEALVGESQREARGAHYTPAELVAEAVDPALDAILRQGPPAHDTVIVDPACGAGAFLLHVHARLTRALHAHPEPALAALDALVGADRDPWAARLARLALALRADAPLDRPRILVGDSLLGPVPGSTEGVDQEGIIDWTRALPWGATAVVGNPPFLGGKRLATVLGAGPAAALRARRSLSGNVDLAVHFLHLASELARPGGHIALVLTDTIAQGENHRDGLGRLVPGPLTLVRATPTRPWPGDAHVHVALVHAVRGPSDLPRLLDGEPVRRISSRLRADRLDGVPPERDEPRPDAFIGCDLKGTGFLFGEPGGHDPAVLQALRSQDADLAEVVRPYVTGRTLSRVPGAVPERLVADLTGLDLHEARARHPGLLDLLERHVKPDRARRTSGVSRAPWWRFWRTRPALRAAIAPLERCLVAPVVARDLVFSWQPTDRVFSHKVLVVATDEDHVLGALQCRLHQHWARALSSPLGQGLNYAPSRCYRTYPLPPRDPAIARAAQNLVSARQHAVTQLGVGLGPLHALVRTGELLTPVQAVRDALDALDQAVLRAWGWTDLDVHDESAVIDRLLDA